jgi:putative peptidoglycan lipid II flippase
MVLRLLWYRIILFPTPFTVYQMQDKFQKIWKNKLLGKTVKLSTITLLSNLLGFLIPIYIAYVYGISKQTDNFFLSYSVITFVNVIFSSAISSVTVPFLKEKLEDKKWLNSFISSFFNFCLKYIGLGSILIFIILLPVSHVIKSNFIFYLALSVPILFFTVLNSFCYGILNSFDRFNMAAMSPFSRAIIIFITIYFFNSSLGMVAVILGYNLGELFKLIHLLYIIKTRNNLSISLKERNYGLIKNFLKEGSFQAISTTISCASPLIDKIVASFLVVGSLSVLDYGDKVVLVFTILLNAFLVIILSKWSTEVIQKTS